MFYRVIGVIVLFSALTALSSCDNGVPKVSTKEAITIVHGNCSSCHRPDGAAPFPLITFDEIKRKSSTIIEVIENGIMPPWPADPEYSHFIGEKVLSKTERKKLLNWLKQNIHGKETNLPSHEIFNEQKSGVRFCMEDEIEIPGDNLDKFRLVRIPIELEQDTFIKAIHFIPGNKKLVHHMNGHWLNYNEEKKKDIYEGKSNVNPERDTDLRLFLEMGIPQDDGSFPELTPSVVNYLPGMETLRYPNGIGGFKANKISSLLMQSIHYGPTPKVESRSSCIEIEYMDGPPKRPIQEIQMGTLGISKIEPEFILEPESKKKFRTQWTTDRDLSLLSIIPHMHLLGTKYKAYALSPENEIVPLIKIDRWDFRWQYVYTFPKILKIPKGYTIIAEGTFDNTSQNSNQAFDPPKRIVEPHTLNMKTTDEMFQLILMFIEYEDGDEHISLK